VVPLLSTLLLSYCVTVIRVSSLIRDWPLRFVIDVYDPCYRLRSVFRSHIRVSGRISSRPLGIGMSSKYFLSVVRSVFVRRRGLRGPLGSYVDWTCRGHLTPLRNILHQGFYVNFMWMSPGGGASNIWYWWFSTQCSMHQCMCIDSHASLESGRTIFGEALVQVFFYMLQYASSFMWIDSHSCLGYMCLWSGRAVPGLLFTISNNFSSHNLK